MKVIAIGQLILGSMLILLATPIAGDDSTKIIQVTVLGIVNLAFGILSKRKLPAPEEVQHGRTNQS